MDQLAERLQAMPPSRQPTPGQLNLVLKELFDSLLKDCERRRDQHHRQRREHVDRREIGLGIVSKILVDRLIEDERHTRSEEHTSELQSLMRIPYAVFCLKTQAKYAECRPTPQSNKEQ